MQSEAVFVRARGAVCLAAPHSYEILVLRPEIKPRPPAVEAWSLNTGSTGNSSVFPSWIDFTKKLCLE